MWRSIINESALRLWRLAQILRPSRLARLCYPFGSSIVVMTFARDRINRRLFHTLSTHSRAHRQRPCKLYSIGWAYTASYKRTLYELFSQHTAAVGFGTRRESNFPNKQRILACLVESGLLCLQENKTPAPSSSVGCYCLQLVLSHSEGCCITNPVFRLRIHCGLL